MRGAMVLTAPTLERGTLVLGDEAAALGAIDAGIACGYAYPGTPSTEIFARVLASAARAGIAAHWAANEKTAYEAALGASLAGRRVLVTMKHVGLNVAADPFVSSALARLRGGLVLAVGDDPGMHSSQDEQDTRQLCAFARLPCLEPATVQEAYDMAREAYDLSERLRVPVALRLVTRLCHERGALVRRPRTDELPPRPPRDPRDWILLPANARELWRRLAGDGVAEQRAWSEASPHNALTPGTGRLGVVTAGVARRYFRELLPELPAPPPHLHVATHPVPVERLRAFARDLDELLVLEDGYPVVERALAGLLPTRWQVRGRDSGDLPTTGELSVARVREALGLAPLARAARPAPELLPARPPRLCDGCPHRDAYAALALALGDRPDALVTGDIGCYTLGALPPYEMVHTCICMGASIGMAKGASDGGLRPAVAVIGDGTFLHSGVTALMDAASHDTDMTVLVLDNRTVAMTGGQPTVLPDSRLVPLIVALGADPAHVHRVHAHPKQVESLAELIRREVAHPGLSVIVVERECLVTARASRHGHAGGSEERE